MKRILFIAIMSVVIIGFSIYGAVAKSSITKAEKNVVEKVQAATPIELERQITLAEKHWLKAIAKKPLLVSLGSFPDLSNSKKNITSILPSRLKLLNRKIFSNRQWREYWTSQLKISRKIETLYGKLLKTPLTKKKRKLEIAKKNGARDWARLANAKTSNQDAFLLSIQMEYDAVDERLESTLISTAQSGKEIKRTELAQASQMTPLKERTARITELKLRQASQSERRAVAILKLKLLKQQVKSSEALQPALKRDAELAQEEYRIAKEQALIYNSTRTNKWRAIAKTIAVKLNKIDKELKLSAERERSLKFDESLVESQVSFRDQKQKEIGQELKKAEAFSGWVKAAIATTGQKAPPVIGLLILVLLIGKISIWVVDIATRALIRMAEDKDPDHVSATERRVNTVASVLNGIGKIIVYFVAILIACDVIGLDTGPIIGSLAILGLALSFGSKNLVQDFVNGFFILVENQYAVGDWVKIGDYEGEVEQINIRSTRLRSVNGVLQIIPNGTISTVENMTRDWARFRCHIGVGYNSDIDMVERICNEVGKEMYADPKLRGNLKEAPVFIGVTELADSAVIVRIMAKTEPGAQWGLEREMNRRLKKSFDESGIEIPFPQRVVWHNNKEES